MVDATRQDPRVARTEATVLTAAGRLLATEGLEAVTFGRISRETGVSRTTLYRHWSGPADLLVAAWAGVAQSNDVARTDDLEADLVVLFLAARDVLEGPAMRRSLPALLAAAQEESTIAELHRAFVRERRQPILDRLEAAKDVGELPPGADSELLVDLLSGPLFYRQLLRGRTTTDAEVIQLVRAVLALARSPSDGPGRRPPRA